MPKKIRELKAMLKKAGFSWRPGKGSHTVWRHLKLPNKRVTLAGNDGDDAKKYMENDVQEAIREVEQQP
jgi:predicted RNA binding protein YcfA (HicA-like mRNA interferase family)